MRALLAVDTWLIAFKGLGGHALLGSSSIPGMLDLLKANTTGKRSRHGVVLALRMEVEGLAVQTQL